MKFDLFYELSVPAALARDESAVFFDALTELELADSLGFNGAWLVEHHFMRGYSHSSAPELFLAAASQRTTRLRLGHGIIPLPYNHPVRVAERLATLDILSRGRLEFGMGRGFSPKEYASFGVAMAASRQITQEALDIIRLSFQHAPVSYQGQHFTLDQIDVLPKVVQRPHPPIWTAAVSPETYELAAQQGIGALAGPFKPWFMVAEDIKLYRRAWQATHGNTTATPGQNNRVGMTVGILCLHDAKRARAIAKPAFEWFYRELFAQTLPVLQKLYDSYEYYRKMGRFHGLIGPAVNLKVLETLGMVIVGNPQHCIERLEKLRAAGVDHVLCAIGAGAVPTDVVRESMHVLASDVMPHFATDARA